MFVFFPVFFFVLCFIDSKTNERAWDMDLLAAELPGLDFEGFEFDFDLDFDKAEVEAVDLDAEDTSKTQEKETIHCPKCGFVFEVKAK